MTPVAEGDRVILLDGKGRRYLIPVEKGARKVKGVGVIDPATLAGEAYGGEFPFGNKTFRILRPTTADLMLSARRKAQTIQPKDAARIVLECGLASGSRVLEAGLGSAWLTIVLARAVAPEGRVTVYEVRDDFADWGRENLARAGLLDVVDVEVRDVTGGIDEDGLDAVVLDMPNPWDAVAHAAGALRGSGVLCTYSPLVSQVEQTREAMAAHGFFDARTVELLEREWVVHEHGSRPDHRMLGHTGFLTFARKGV